MHANRLLGTLARWNVERGFGFITPDGGGADIFVHASDMSRIGGAPQAGWRLDFRVRNGKDGRPRAFDVQREGMPLARPPHPASPGRPAPRPRARYEHSHRTPGLKSPALALVVVAVLGVAAFVFLRDGASQAPSVEASMPLAAPLRASDAPPSFKCDGRTQCSQMTSCEEARFFLEHCPDTKMDGNGDGEPCEQQWCN